MGTYKENERVCGGGGGMGGGVYTYMHRKSTSVLSMTPAYRCTFSGSALCCVTASGHVHLQYFWVLFVLMQLQ